MKTIKESIEKWYEYELSEAEPDRDNLDFDSITAEIKRIVLESLPASNRKSCSNSEHYMSRFKEGWNCCRSAVRKVVEKL